MQWCTDCYARTLSTVKRLSRTWWYSCDPDCLVQPPNSWIPPESIGQGARSLFGGWPGSPENVSCSRATPRLHLCKFGFALEQETFSGLPGHPPKRLLAPSPIDLGGIQEFGGCTRQSGSQQYSLNKEWLSHLCEPLRVLVSRCKKKENVYSHDFPEELQGGCRSSPGLEPPSEPLPPDLICQINLSVDTFSIEAPQHLLRTKRISKSGVTRQTNQKRAKTKSS